MSKKKYTVLLAYPEHLADHYAESYLAHVMAEGPLKAFDAACEQCIKDAECGEMGDPPGSDLVPIAIFKGWLEDAKP